MTQALSDRDHLRATLRARRKVFVAGLPASVRTLAFRVLPSPVMALLAPDARVALYRPVGSEAPTDAIAHNLADLDFPLCLPRLGGKPDDPHFMDFAAWTPEEDLLVPGPSRILQPSFDAEAVTPDVAFIPLVGFDAALNRLGQGAGHYDRALEALPDTLKIGLAWSVQQVDHIPAQSWDVPLDLIITEQRIFERKDI
ncbi:MAG TPA: 5-formyltetrahydrofolate cyclo-ligase [Sphingobium sp.]|nr:5-formyltetrahydrofolate cyclo-ligase [Sphingobium sp.]